jgi:imidazolonepropionase-like amidohydrolase
LGVIEAGAYADILLVDGNPLEDITVLGGNKEWFTAKACERGIETIRLIMKNGKVYKNTIGQ